MGKWTERFVFTLTGILIGLLWVLCTVHIGDTAIIKMYTEGKIVCTTLAEEFICKEVEK